MIQQVAPWSNPVVLANQSVAGGRETTLGWILLITALVTTVIVTGLVIAAVTRGRASSLLPPERGSEGLKWIMIGGLIVPTVVLGAVFILTMMTQAAVAAPVAAAALTVEVIGHRWWWEVRYRGESDSGTVFSANEIHVPVGTPVRIELSTGDVIHSLWVPNLGGKTDLIPGQTNVTWIQADSVGVYRGQCAEYCGTEHTKMAIALVAQSKGEYQQWIEQQRLPATSPTDPDALSGLAVFTTSACAGCHTIRGTKAAGVLGPDLTHLASRFTIAGATLPNSRGNLAGWIANPQAIKPGSLMPVTPLTPAQLLSVVTYLQTLK
jgi:cytochrome c oxidase subunit 2